jgi:hypothetical protein
VDHAGLAVSPEDLSWTTHRVCAEGPDEDLLDELVSVRLRKNTLGIYRLDHDSGQHDDQAVALALGTYWLLGDDSTAEEWIAWARRESHRSRAIIIGPATGMPEPLPAPAPAAAAGPAEHEPPELEGVVLDPVTARKLARDQRFRESPDGVMLQYLSRG